MVVTVYKIKDYQTKPNASAREYLVGQEDTSLIKGDFNERISSLKVKSGYIAILYEHENYSGDVIVMGHDCNNLSDYNWNNRVSSIKVRSISELLKKESEFDNMKKSLEYAEAERDRLIERIQNLNEIDTDNVNTLQQEVVMTSASRTSRSIEQVLDNIDLISQSTKLLTKESVLGNVVAEIKQYIQRIRVLEPGDKFQGLINTVDEYLVNSDTFAGLAIERINIIRQLLSNIKVEIEGVFHNETKHLDYDLLSHKVNLFYSETMVKKILEAFEYPPCVEELTSQNEDEIKKSIEAIKESLEYIYYIGGSNLDTENKESINEAIINLIKNYHYLIHQANQEKLKIEQLRQEVKRKLEQSGKLYERNSKALDKLFGLSIDSPHDEPETNNRGIVFNQLEKSVKRLFGFDDANTVSTNIYPEADN
ncbi:beta/gamma crystallin-related protein [Umezakia ovalisporum]|jgi:hypothetical protein|uniref:beta/gamma crystallin-related protein n=1 Tax=Umezakia ovalisporum TaxID=75695 RepID=UPI00247647B5|nr:beta/gamma crystallin-related protein [Umezakia ovalisporum]MBI1240821.1 hypothetical protein [Nostoc sp. RI_552]MDH6083602.1 beta/gamma crystallin-related protein [Umezakia ovalisporum TAC611]